MNPQEQEQPELYSVETSCLKARVLLPIAQVQVRQLSPAALAYLGDAVYELYIRTHCLVPPSRLASYHRQVISHVRAESQALYLRLLQPQLTPAELEILRQGRNAVQRRPRRLNPVTYQQATSFEALIGYLYLTDPPRLDQLFQSLDLEATESD